MARGRSPDLTPHVPGILTWEAWQAEHDRRRRARVGFLLSLGGAVALPCLFALWSVAGRTDRALPFFAVAVLAAIIATLAGLLMQRWAAPATPPPLGRRERWAVWVCTVLVVVEVLGALLLDGTAATHVAAWLPSTGIVGQAIVYHSQGAPPTTTAERWRTEPAPLSRAAQRAAQGTSTDLPTTFRSS